VTTRALILARLSATPRLLRELTSDVTAAQAWTAPAPGEWSIGEIARHLVEGDRDTFLPRLRRMLAEARPVFDARGPTTGEAGDLATLLAAFAAAREQVVKTLAGLDAGGWSREGVSPSRGPLTVETYAQSMAEHDTEHLGQIHEVRETLRLRPKR